MRNILKDYDEEKLKQRVSQKVEEGWTQVSEIKKTEPAFYTTMDTYFCVMEMPDKPNTGKSKRFNFQY